MGNISWRKAIGANINGFLIKDYKYEKETEYSYVYVECPYCHKDRWMRTDWIKSGKVVSCGCYGKSKLYKPIDIKGQCFGKLKAIKSTGRTARNNSIIWECECVCGEKAYISASSLTQGKRKSCGCDSHEIAKRRYEMALAKFHEKDKIGGTSLHAITSKKVIATNTSGITGVTYDKFRGRWKAQIVFQGKSYFLGRYDKIEDAADARRIAEDKLHKDFLKWYEESKKDERI